MKYDISVIIIKYLKEKKNNKTNKNLAEHNNTQIRPYMINSEYMNYLIIVSKVLLPFPLFS